MSIVLVGLKNSGKTTIGKKFARSLKKTFIDTDDLIIKQYNQEHSEETHHIGEVHNQLGEAAFREFEQEVIGALQPNQEFVIATGGGCYLQASSIKTLQQLGKIIYLYLTKKEFIARIHQAHNSSYLQDSNLSQIYEARHAILDNIFYKKIDIEGKELDTILHEMKRII